MKKKELIVLLVMVSLAISFGSTESSSAQQKVLERGKCDLLDFLSQLSREDSEQVISGQNINSAPHIASNYMDYITAFDGSPHLQPAMIGVDYGWDRIPDLTMTNNLIMDFWNRGGLVTISMHPGNPATGGSVRDRDFSQFADIITEGNPIHASWMETLGKVADGLEDLAARGVTVLWRPLHEMNGGWFWWSPEQNQKWASQEEFVSLWRHMYHYFTDVRGLTNLLWVYSPGVQIVQPGWRMQDVLYYYPGDDYVDIVGLDYYDDDMHNLNLNDSYDKLVQLGKPMAIAEIGPQNQRDGTFDNSEVVRGIKEQYPHVAYFMFWHSWTGAKVAMVDNRNYEKLMADTSVITLADVQRMQDKVR